MPTRNDSNPNLQYKASKAIAAFDQITARLRDGDEHGARILLTKIALLGDRPFLDAMLQALIKAAEHDAARK